MKTVEKEKTSSSFSPKAIITYRGEKVEISLEQGVMVDDLKEAVLRSHHQKSMEEGEQNKTMTTTKSSKILQAKDLKLMYRGKILKQDVQDNNNNNKNEKASITMPLDALQVLQTLGGGGGGGTSTQNKKKVSKVYKIVATGVSKVEVETLDADVKHGIQSMERNVRDDLTSQGQRDMKRRKRLGESMLQKAAAKNQGGVRNQATGSYCFGKIETLPNLPNQDQAKKILEKLANDPGILACMRKHQFKVGTLGEMYPDGKVGESEVCIMGLNENAGQRILLRLRTDDLSGFRKMLSIRKVLFHELAHNVHSEHNLEFFKLMRQIEHDCNNLDWTKGAGLTPSMSNDDDDDRNRFEGGTYRLGGGSAGCIRSIEDVGGSVGGTMTETTTKTDVRELAALAAMLRMTAEEEMIEQDCGCKKDDLFLPDSEKHKK